MDDDQEMESSPMETVYSWSEHSKESKNNYKRKYQEDSGYTTTPSSSQSTCGIGFTLGISSDEGFSESPREKTSELCDGCGCSKEWDDWEKAVPLLPSTPEASVNLPVISPTQPKLSRSRDIPWSNTSWNNQSGGFTLHRPYLRSRCSIVHSHSDFVHRFAVSSNLHHILDMIFSYLSDSDVTTLTMVSKTWYEVITKNKVTRERWLNNIAVRKSSKENLNSCEKTTWMRSPLKARNYRAPLTSTPVSPPVSPSKFKFNLFRKEAEKLKEGEWLMHCPSCDLPCKCTPAEKRAKCIRVGCALDFCTDCRNPYHLGSPCVLLSPPGNRTPQKRISKAQSKRNLRRLII